MMNHPYVHDVLPKLALPRYLSHVEVLADLRGVPRSLALREAGAERRIVWADEDGANSAGGRALESALDRLLDRVLSVPSQPLGEQCPTHPQVLAS